MLDLFVDGGVHPMNHIFMPFYGRCGPSIQERLHHTKIGCTIFSAAYLCICFHQMIRCSFSTSHMNKALNNGGIKKVVIMGRVTPKFSA